MLKEGHFFIRQSISLGNNRNQIDLGVQPAHDFDVQRLQRMPSRLDEVNTGVYTVVHNICAVDLVLCFQEAIESLLNVLDNWTPRIIVVDKVAKSRSINNRQTKTNALLLNVCAGGLDCHGLWDNIMRRTTTFPGRIERTVEQSVDEGRFTQSGFTCDGKLANSFISIVRQI